MSSSAPRKPLLNGLSGKYEIANEVRCKLDIPPGILVGDVKSWSNVDTVIHNYFESLKSLSIDSNDLLQEFNATFTKLEKCTNSKLNRYAKDLKTYYSNNIMRKKFHNAFADEQMNFAEKKSEKRAMQQGRITAGALAVEGGIHLENNSKRRAESEADDKQDGHQDKRQSCENNNIIENDYSGLERIPSDLTDNYHPRRKEPYFFYTTEEQDINHDEYLHDMDDNYVWSIEPSIDITRLCYQFKGNTLKLSNRPEQLSDTRLLALHDIYLFNLSDQSKSIGKYWCPSIYKSAVDDIPYLDPPRGQKSATWCTSISLKRHRNWIAGLTDSAKYLVEATESNNIVDIHAMQAAVELVPVFISTPLNYSIEDTYVHNWIAPILKPIFSCEPLLSIEWANKYINQHHKPDFITGVKGINSWLPIVIGEFKKPGFTSCLETDLVKIGKEMRTMVNSLVRIGVDNPSVGAILIQGRVINTFKMDIVAPKCYRMVSLSTMTMFDSLSDLSILPTIVSRFLQIKEISLVTARKVQVLDRERAAQMKPSSLSPQYAWLSKSNFILRKVTPITSSNSDEYKNND